MWCGATVWLDDMVLNRYMEGGINMWTMVSDKMEYEHSMIMAHD